MPENLRINVPDLIQAALYKTFPTLPAWEVATDGRDHRAEGKNCEVDEDPDRGDESQSIP